MVRTFFSPLALFFLLIFCTSTFSLAWVEEFDSEPIDFTENQYFSVSGGRLHFNGDPALTYAESVAWNSGLNPGGKFPLPGNSNYFENCVVSVDTFWEGRATDWPYGLLLCGRDITDSTSCLGHRVNGNSEYSISYSKPSGKGFFVYNTFSSLNNPDGQNNTVSVKKVGPYYYFYINGVEVQRRIISDVYGGSVGLYAFHPVDAAFDNFAVSKIGYEAFEDDSNNVIENFNTGVGGFGEDDYYKVSNDRYVFLGNRTDFTRFYIWNGGFSPGGWAAEPDDSNYFVNFTASVDAYWEGGADDYGYGLTVCSQKNSLETRDSVKFYIDGDGWYMIGKRQNDIWQTLVNWTESPFISTGGLKNKLSVQKDGSQFHFSINGTEVELLTIDGIFGGGAGVEVSQHVDVSFDDFTITQPGIPPTADAGTDQSVTEGNSVDLNGSGSSDDTAITSYQWYQLQGPPVEISDLGATNPTFTAPDVLVPSTTLAFQLKVTDDVRLHDSDITLVEVACMNVTGDVDGNCSVDLKDAIIPLQVVTGMDPAEVRSDYVTCGVDISGDNQVGTEESINALRVEAGF